MAAAVTAKLCSKPFVSAVCGAVKLFYINFAKLHPYFKRCASDSERERHCARILPKFRENTVAPYGSRL